MTQLEYPYGFIFISNVFLVKPIVSFSTDHSIVIVFLPFNSSFLPFNRQWYECLHLFCSFLSFYHFLPVTARPIAQYNGYDADPFRLKHQKCWLIWHSNSNGRMFNGTTTRPTTNGRKIKRISFYLSLDAIVSDRDGHRRRQWRWRRRRSFKLIVSMRCANVIAFLFSRLSSVCRRHTRIRNTKLFLSCHFYRVYTGWCAYCCRRWVEFHMCRHDIVAANTTDQTFRRKNEIENQNPFILTRVAGCVCVWMVRSREHSWMCVCVRVSKWISEIVTKSFGK